MSISAVARIVPDDYIMMYENWAKYEEVCDT